jgi:hypothetical protein
MRTAAPSFIVCVHLQGIAQPLLGWIVVVVVVVVLVLVLVLVPHCWKCRMVEFSTSTCLTPKVTEFLY